MRDPFIRRKHFSMLLSVFGLLAGVLVFPGRAELPLASVHYFNPYQNPTNWGGWGSAVYQGNGATVVNISNTVPVTNINGVSAMVLNAINPPGAYWNVLFKVSGNPLNWLRTGSNPALHLRLNWSAIPTDGEWNMTIVPLGGNVTASVPLNKYVTASTNSWQDVYIPASAFLAVQPALDLTHVWQVAMQAAGNYSDHCTLNIAALDVVPSTIQTNYTEFAKVDQLGYPPLEASKIGLVTWEPGAIATPPTTFQVVNTSNSQIVLTGPVTPFIQPNIWQASGWTLDGDVNYQADFSALRTSGTYTMQLPGLGVSSPPFVIATNVYQELFRDTLRFFYFSRATYPIVNPFAEGITRAAVHPETTNASYNYSPVYGNFNFGTNTTRDAHGCWFDAGDTHVDVPDTAVACWFLLETAHDFGSNAPPFWLNLPESTNGQSDLVPLIYNALDWLERMQNSDGSVNHYIMGNPNSAAQVQQVSDTSSFAAACVAGTFAKAYAILSPWLTPAQSADLLSRAELSWSWLQNHPNMVQPRLPLQNGVDPGAFDTSWGGATFDSQCRAYAAVELFVATGQAVYNNYFVSQFNGNGGSPLNGPVFGVNTTGYGSDNVITYLNNVLEFAFMDYVRENNNGNSSIQATLQAAFQHQADTLTNYTALSNYRIPMLYPGHLYWGSSGGVLAPSAMVLARAWQWTGKIVYHAAAIQALHFICGRNPVNRIFVSGYGDYQHGSDFYSTFWTNLLQQPPGYVGANINVDGSAAPDVTYPWKCFIDSQDADMTEPGVYWNSAVAWLAGYVANDATPPALQAVPAVGKLSIAWPVRSATYLLYQSTNLSLTSGWTFVTNSAVQSNNFWTVNVSPPATSTYYSLQAQ
jgi:endoglucanase